MDWQPIESAPRDGTWVWLYGELYGEPHGELGFWSTNADDVEGDPWFASEAASNPITAFGWRPTHWAPFDAPDGRR